MQPYLIQRAKFENRENRKGIDALLSFDYMGSAEFEFGALPNSLKRVRQNISDYIVLQHTFKKNPSKSVTVFCKKEQKEFVGEILDCLAERKFRLKEYCDLAVWVENNEPAIPRCNDFWWDILNDWFFWKINPEFESKFFKNF